MKVSLRHNWFSSQKVEFVHKFVTACGKQELFLSQEALLVRSNECVWSSQALHLSVLPVGFSSLTGFLTKEVE